MKVIFLDNRINHLHSTAQKLKCKFPEAYIVLFGTKKKIIGYDLVNIPGAPEDGVAIQEWLNRNLSISNICIVTECDTIRPLTEYIVKPTCMVIYKVDKMLKQPYENKMKGMVSAGNTRKHF